MILTSHGLPLNPALQNINIQPDSSIIIPETSSDAASTSNCNTNQYLQYINILEEQNVQAGTYILLLFKKILLKIYNIIIIIYYYFGNNTSVKLVL